ncbi:hypothetical protein Ciccas_001522 [Cichlidogyrus casuarinus]|uniref:Autophagy-related protein 2 n=1 Tax=Cichlidogyrus casuarinus TaxID=1844966 RepID=A0ABD2QMX5_9PLAT
MGCWDLFYYPMASIWTTEEMQGRVATRALLQGGFVQGVRTGAHSFSTSTLWAALELTTISLRAFRGMAEMTYDVVSPGMALRTRLPRMKQPSDLRQGFGNAYTIMQHGIRIVQQDIGQAVDMQSYSNDPTGKGSVGLMGEVLRQIPPALVAPVVTGCEVMLSSPFFKRYLFQAASNVVRGFRNQIKPEARLEDEQNWKESY